MTLTIEGDEAARAVLGPRDGHLRRVREALGVTVVFRGGKLTIDGAKPSVARAAVLSAKKISARIPLVIGPATAM